MKKWIVHFDNAKIVETLERLEILSYIPTLYEELKFVFIRTDMSKEEILRIEGITKVTESRIGSLNV